MMTESRKNTLHAMLLEAFFWMSNCAYGGFIVTMLTDYGYSSATATALMTCMAAVSFIAQPITGYLCDNYFSQRKLYLVLISCSVPLYLLLSRSMASLPLTVLCMFFITLTMQQVTGLVDAWLVHLQQEDPRINYGLCRGTGSLTYAAAAQVMGAITTRYSHDARLLTGAVLGVISLIVAFTLRGAKVTYRDPREPEPAPLPKNRLGTVETIRVLVKNKTYLLMLCMSFTLFLGSSSLNTFLPVLVRELGGDSAQVGTLFAVCAISEVPAMFLMSAILRRFRAKYVILFSSVFYALRLGLTCLAPNLTLLFAIQIMQGLSFAVLWPASINYLNRIVEDQVKSTAVMTYSSVTLGIAGIFGNAIGTLILSLTGNVRLVFVFAGTAAAVGLMIGLFGLAKKIWK